MEDDIDVLLDLVEKQHFIATNRNCVTATIEASQRNSNDELADIISDICSTTDTLECHDSATRTVNENGNCKNASAIGAEELKCSRILLAGSGLSVGQNDAGNGRPCSNLRCIGCDFKVIPFDDYEWDSATDYLFLRNNMPESAKLRTHLVPRKGCRAYACQCSWINITSVLDVKSESRLKWICGKH